MIAYHNDSKAKAAILKTLRAHAKADEFVKGQYWEGGKGCAVGCTIKSSDHAEYEPRFGIPRALAILEDTIFEGLPNDEAKKWPVQFMSAIKPGADLSLVQWQFLHWLLTDENVNPGINHPLVKDAVARVAEMVWGLADGKPVDVNAARSAAWSAESAARSAESAWSAWSAARSAWSAAESAARSAWSAESAARSAESAARSAESAARSAEAYSLMANKLLALLKDAPLGEGTP